MFTKFVIFFTFSSLNHPLIFAQQNQENQKTLSPLLNSTEQDHHRNGLPSQPQQQTTYSAATAQLSNSGFVPIAKPLIAKLPERYDSTQTDADQQQVDPGAVLTRMGYTNSGNYEVPGYGSTNYNYNYSPAVNYDQSSASLLRNLKQESIGAQEAQDSAQQNVYDVSSIGDRNLLKQYNEKYNKYLQSQANNANEEYSVASQSSPDVTSSQNFYKQLNNDQEVSKFLKSAASESNEEMASADQTSDTGESEAEYPTVGQNQQMNDFTNQLNKDQKNSYPMLNEEQQMITPEMAQQLFKQFAQTQDMSSNSLNENQISNSGSSDSDMQSLLNQLSLSSQSSMPYSLPQKAHSELMSGLQEFSANNLQQMANYGQQMAGSQMTAQMANNQALPVNGLQNFSPAPEGGQLPAPPGYKHVGYITIPAGTANVPNIMSTGTAGLPIIRPMPLMSGLQDTNRLPLGMTQKHLQSFQDQSKKQQEKQTSESKPRRTFLSRLNPLNMLRRLRQRRERRQTFDSVNGVNQLLRMSNSGIYGMTPSMQSGNYGGSISGLGGMSGLNGMYASMSGPQPVYAGMPGSYAPAMSPFGGSYGGYPAMSGYMPSLFGQSGSAQISKDMSQLTASASNSEANSQAMSVPMMMPYTPMGGFSQMAPMAMQSMPMGSMPYAMIPQQTQQDESPENNPNQLPGGLNLSDLLKDEEDEEPSRFRRFLSYLNPINLFRRLRDRNATESDDRKRFGRYRRHIRDEEFGEKSFIHFPETSHESSPRMSRVLFLKRSGRKSRMRFPRNDDSEVNAFNETNDSIDDNKTDDKLDSADSGVRPLQDHTSDESVGRSRNRFNYRRNRRPQQRTHFSSEGRHIGLMGSGNFEVIRGGTFRPEEKTSSSTHSTPEEGSVYDGESSGNVFSALEDEFFDSGSPEVLGFQGFNGFGSMSYNSLSASNKIPKLATIGKRRSDGLIGNIENAALTTTELKATS